MGGFGWCVDSVDCIPHIYVCCACVMYGMYSCIHTCVTTCIISVRHDNTSQHNRYPESSDLSLDPHIPRMMIANYLAYGSHGSTSVQYNTYRSHADTLQQLGWLVGMCIGGCAADG